MNTKVKETLAVEIANINNSIPNIARGGCGIFALYLFNLLSNIGLKPEIKFVYLNSDKKDDFNRDLKNVEVNEHALNYLYDEYKWHHIMIEVNGLIIDSKGVFKNLKETQYDYGTLSEASMSIDALEGFCLPKYKGIWNPSFDRSMYRDELRRKIKSLEKKLEKYLEN